MIIEFLGMPGAGKSTAIWKAATLLRARGRSVRVVNGYGGYSAKGQSLSSRQRRWRRILAGVRYPDLVRRGLREAGSRRESAAVMKLAYQQKTQRELRRRTGVVLLDEGPHDGLCKLSANFEVDVTDIAPALVSPDVLVVVEEDPGISLSRVRDRGDDVEVARLVDPAAMDYLERYSRAMEHVVASACARTLRVPSPEEAARLLVGSTHSRGFVGG